MIDVRTLRTEREAVLAALGRRGIDLAPVEEAARLDEESRRRASERDAVRARIKELSKEVGAARKAGDAARADALQAESRSLGDDERAAGVAADAAAAELRDLLLRIPNVPHRDAPDGASEDDNPEVRRSQFDPDGFAPHQRVPHWETGARLAMLDLERGAKISGSMFPLYRGAGATLARALCQLALDLNADAFEEIRPPTLVRTDTLMATGHLPKFADDAYAIERDDLWTIPTAEVPLTSVGRDEVYAERDLPVRMMACTPCYRREAGSAGRDTRGLLRVHEFDKVEILAYATADQAPALLEEMVGRAERALQLLELPHRIIEICTGDMGQSHHRSFDLEVYAPGCDQWLEVSSVSWFSDYQARRANIRYRPDAGNATELVHTLNGSALAVPRVWAALVENHLDAEGTVRIPEVLWPYMRGIEYVKGT